MLVPLAGDRAATVVAWNPRHDKAVVRNLFDVVNELVTTVDLTEAG
ncbi:hypothetical protein AB0395_12030 [Streptosporangium sp. NPDC051023]